MPEQSWIPSAPLNNLQRRAEILAKIRAFFSSRGVLEVETPLLSRHTATDLHLHTLIANVMVPGTDEPEEFFLQTSPEFAMKRLLASGSGPIFQICKAFRDEESGRIHNPEFTMLEWYRPGWDHHRLMDEMDALLQGILGIGPARRVSYGDLFVETVDVDAHRDDDAKLRRRALELGLDDIRDLDREGWLSLLMTHLIERSLGRDRPTFVFDYPVDQAALAKVRPGDPPVAERFEVYVEGVELANGYHELTDAEEQRRRFEHDLKARRERGLPQPEIDHRLLAALEHGLPECAGVALGVDRLVMLAAKGSTIDEVIAFPIDRA
ncbi:MAG: elongation factor P--(R)-beta-lysine ligase [Thermoanaerobaculales bacterium]|nr:elongation factor P--(R)-beta-lysine ligase [Thermoanaerobaculales bacterium]